MITKWLRESIFQGLLGVIVLALVYWIGVQNGSLECAIKPDVIEHNQAAAESYYRESAKIMLEHERAVRKKEAEYSELLKRYKRERSIKVGTPGECEITNEQFLKMQFTPEETCLFLNGGDYVGGRCE